MLFTTDKQTLADLNIFGKHGSDCIYAIFNRCATRGGATVMEEMFRYPLSDEEAINKRSAIIRGFAQEGLSFPFEAALFDVAETYLANTDERSRLVAGAETMSRRIGDMVGADAESRQIQAGVKALAGILQQTKLFVANPAFNNSSPLSNWQDNHLALNNIINNAALIAIAGSTEKPDAAQMAAWDGLLRFKHRDIIQQLLRQIYQLDVFIAVARVATLRGFCFPQALPPGEQALTIRNVFHPQVKNAVANSISFSGDANLVFLTGANMAGKSTFMKSVSVAVFLAQMGFPVPAEEMAFSVFNGIYTTINLPDNLGMGASHFYAEVLRVKKVMAELNQNKRLFILFDELFRGTNVKDAYEATIAITKGFARRQNSVFIISTHITEAADPLAKACSNISFRYLPTTMNGRQPVYTYQLAEGISTDRHGMLIINNEGIPQILNGRQTVTRDQVHSNGFIIDRQSLDDLNLTGKFRPYSVFSLFNGVVTRGGERLLDDMFQHPMTNREAIQERTTLFRYFGDKPCKFPLTGKLAEALEHYLQTAGASNLLLTTATLLHKKTTKAILHDGLYDQWKQGLECTISALQRIAVFMDTLTSYPYPDQLAALRRLFADRRIATLLQHKDNQQLTVLAVAKYHHLLLTVFRSEMRDLLKMLYYLDVYIAVSRIAKEKGFSYAQVLPDKATVFHAEGIWHPGVEKPVTNTLLFSSEQNLLFLTGANMAGKSTLMKSFGIAVYLAHMGFPVAATAMKFSVMDGLYCSINVPDSLSLGYSHFYAEVLRVKKVAEEVAGGKRLAILFDELFKGTNVKDAYDATLACSNAFAEHNRCFYIISTHITEVGEALKASNSRIQFEYLPTVITDNIPRYTYRLTKGITEDRQGMMIIENEGLLSDIS